MWLLIHWPNFNGGVANKNPTIVVRIWMSEQFIDFCYCQTSIIKRTKSQNLNVSRLVWQLSLSNPLKSGVKSRMKMQPEQRRQAMLQLHPSDQEVYYQCATFIRGLEVVNEDPVAMTTSWLVNPFRIAANLVWFWHTMACLGLNWNPWAVNYDANQVVRNWRHRNLS